MESQQCTETEGGRPQACFQSLPPELRNQIYEMVVVSGYEVDLTMVFKSEDIVRDMDCPPILKVTGPVGREAQSIYFATNKFMIPVCWSRKAPHRPSTIPGDDSKCCEGIRGLRQLFNRVGKWRCGLMKELTLYWDHSKLMTSLTNLEAMAAWTHLWVDVSLRKTVAPDLSTIMHVCPKRSDHLVSCSIRHESRQWPTPPTPLYDFAMADANSSIFPVDLGTDLGPRIPERMQSNPIQQTLRAELAALGKSLARSGRSMRLSRVKLKVVEWICHGSGNNLEIIKAQVRDAWAGRKHPSRKEALTLFHELRRHRCFFLRLPPALRSTIYDLVLPKGRLECLDPVDPATDDSDSANDNESGADEDVVTDDDLFGWVTRTPPIPHTPPPLLLLDHIISKEARITYFQNTEFYTSLQFVPIDILRVKNAIRKLGKSRHARDLKVDLYFKHTETVTIPAIVDWARLFAERSRYMPEEGCLRYSCIVDAQRDLTGLAFLKDIELMGRSINGPARKIHQSEEKYEYIEERVHHFLKAMLDEETSSLTMLSEYTLDAAIKEWRPREPRRYLVHSEEQCPHRRDEGPSALIRCPWCLHVPDVASPSSSVRSINTAGPALGDDDLLALGEYDLSLFDLPDDVHHVLPPAPWPVGAPYPDFDI